MCGEEKLMEQGADRSSSVNGYWNAT